MNPYRFRPIGEWKTALMNFPSFFDLMRSIFGNIKTPYNKQRLIEDLVVLLSRDDIRKTIRAYLDGEDHKIIAAVALLGDPSTDELEDFFAGDKNSARLRGLVLNLEERFILFRFNDEASGKKRYALNPVLESVLEPFAADKKNLFPSEPAEKNEAAGNRPAAVFSVSDDRALGAFFTFILEGEDFFRSGGIRKKVTELAKKFFPGLDLDRAAGIVGALGLFYSEGEKFLPVIRKINGFGELSPAERREYWAAGLYVYSMESEENSGVSREFRNTGSRNRVHNIAGLIHKFAACLEPEKQYPEIAFRRLVRLLEPEMPRGLWPQPEPVNPGLFVNALEAAGILGKNAAGSAWYPVPVRPADFSGPVIAMDSAFSFVLYPGIRFRDVLRLAAFSSVRDESPFHFELTRDSVVRGFDRGIGSGEITETLKAFSGNPVDKSLEWTLKDWESRYDAVSLHEGLVLSLSEDRRYLAKTGPVAAMIRKTLAPGLYLLSAERGEAAAALQKTGVDIVAQPESAPVEQGGGYGAVFPQFRFAESGSAFFGDAEVSLPAASSQKTREHFRDHLAKLKLSKPEAEELLARIDRRIILTETQLEKAEIKYQKLEARGLDYAGKASIAKQAVAEGSALEITWPGAGGGANTVTGIPEALEKKEGEGVLVLKPFGGPDEAESETLRIPLGKISLLRMQRQSILSD